MDVSPPSLSNCNGTRTPKSSAGWAIEPPTSVPKPTPDAVVSTPADPLSEQVNKALTAPLTPLVIPETLYDAPGVEETTQRMEELEDAVKAICQEDPQRAAYAADGEALVLRANGEMAAIQDTRQQVASVIARCPKRVRRPKTAIPTLGKSTTNAPMAWAAKATLSGLIVLLLLELSNAVWMSMNSGWPFTEYLFGAVLFTTVFVVGPFSLLWWAEASAPRLVKERLVATRRWTSIAVAASSMIAFGLAVGLEHTDVIPAYDEPEPWSVPLPALTVLSVTMLALTMLAGKSAFAACWDRLRGMETVDNPQLAELTRVLDDLDRAMAIAVAQWMRAKKLVARLEADVQTHQTIARQALRAAIETAAEEWRRRDVQRRLRQVQAELDRGPRSPR